MNSSDQADHATTQQSTEPVPVRASNWLLPVGAEFVPREGVSFRVWAPRSRAVSVQFYAADGSRAQAVELAREPRGYFSALVAAAKPGDRYMFKLNAEEFADPVSRFQPTGPFGPSEVIAPAFAWPDQAWRGRFAPEYVMYEMHLGTFTPEGTWAAAAEQLPELACIGVTVLEIMPLAEFFGDSGWGYDGVNLFAPSHLYGSPLDATQQFFDSSPTHILKEIALAARGEANGRELFLVAENEPQLAQAWSVAELLRVWVLTETEDEASRSPTGLSHAAAPLEGAVAL